MAIDDKKKHGRRHRMPKPADLADLLYTHEESVPRAYEAWVKLHEDGVTPSLPTFRKWCNSPPVMVQLAKLRGETIDSTTAIYVRESGKWARRVVRMLETEEDPRVILEANKQVQSYAMARSFKAQQAEIDGLKEQVSLLLERLVAKERGQELPPLDPEDLAAVGHVPPGPDDDEGSDDPE